ncbi:MAG: cbb3-type cytochrome c oxidase N-terminal domain-containing protein [Ferruginibacter sp.]
MRFINKPLSRSILILILSLPVTTGFAQNAVAQNETSSHNQLATLMIVIALLLAFVIWGLGQVLVTMGKQALDKSRLPVKVIPVTLAIVFSFLSFTTNAQDAVLAEKIVVPNYGGMDSTSFWILAAVIFTELLVIAFMMFSIRRIQVELLPQAPKVEMLALKQFWQYLDKKLFTRAVAVEKEADILLDHDYDGIKELDNALPPWWKYGFIITIVVAFVYLLNFHVLGYGKNPTEEYQEEIVKAQEAKELYESKNANKIDETNLKMPAAAGIAAGKEIFTSVCWACHGKQGEGGAGPNLTDDHWLHKGSLADIYQSIKHGYPDKGMQSWEKNFTPNEINDLAGFIITLRGTTPPNPKEAQGELYKDTPDTDSTILKTTVEIKKDTAAIIKK